MEDRSAQDRDLVRSALQGDARAFADLVTRYQRLVGSVAWRYGIRREEIEDLVSEVFTKVFKNLHRYRPEHPFSTWLYRLAANHVVDHVRRSRREALRVEMPEEVTDQAGGPGEDAEVRERAALVREALNDVPPRYREALFLVYVEGLRVEEVARTLEMPQGTIKSRLLRGREALRKILVRRHPEYFGGQHALP